MDKNQLHLTEAIKNAERAIALLRDCRVSANGNTIPVTRARSMAATAIDELTDSLDSVGKFIKSLPKNRHL